MDENTTFGQLKKQVSEFRDARGWLKDDTPRSLAISISVEAAELLEHFQWTDDRRAREALVNEKERVEISNELADVMIYCLGFADVLEIDLSKAIMNKLRINCEKYPIKQKVSA